MVCATRRYFLISSAALSLGCTTRRPQAPGRAASDPAVREPVLGQSWRYAKRDLYTHALLDDQIDNDVGLPWEQTMHARDWEIIAVPAGQFRALRFSNMITFRSADFSRADCQRQETVWIAPEVGRWVARESSGTYYIDDSAADTPYNESAYRWELLEWT